MVLNDRTAGAIGDDTGDVVSVSDRRAAELRSVMRGAMLLGMYPETREERTAGDVRSGSATGVPPGVEASRWWSMSQTERDAWFESRASGGGSRASEIFDPADPAAMTRDRWDRMSETERRAWIAANVASETERNRMLSNLATQGFDTVREYIRSEREQRLTEVRETAQTAREQIRADADVERARIAAETERARIAAETARAEMARATATAATATSTAEREAAEAEARAAAERLATAREAEARLAAERAARAASVPWWDRWYVKVAGVLAALLGAAGIYRATMRPQLASGS